MYGVREAIRLNFRDYYFLLRSTINFGSDRTLYLCNSYPKSGTHLLSQILLRTGVVRYWDDIISVQSLSGYMNDARHIRWKYESAPGGSLVRSHLTYDPKILAVLARRTHKRFFIYRDPRDVVCSHAHWVVKEPATFLHGIYKDHLGSPEERIAASIVGTPLGSPFGSNKSHPSIEADFSRWRGWLRDPATLSLKFEDLVGKRGGGSEETRLEKIRQILEWMNLPARPAEVASTFGSEVMDPRESHTYKRGQKGAIGAWKEQFTAKHKELFKRYAGELLIELGYEDGGNW